MIGTIEELRGLINDSLPGPYREAAGAAAGWR